MLQLTDRAFGLDDFIGYIIAVHSLLYDIRHFSSDDILSFNAPQLF